MPPLPNQRYLAKTSISRFGTAIRVFDNFNTFRKNTFNLKKIEPIVFAEFGFEKQGRPRQYELRWLVSICDQWQDLALLSMLTGPIWLNNAFLTCLTCFAKIFDRKFFSNFFDPKIFLDHKLFFWHLSKFYTKRSTKVKRFTFSFLNCFCELHANRNWWLLFSQQLADEEFPRFFAKKVCSRWGHVAQSWAPMVQNVCFNVNFSPYGHVHRPCKVVQEWVHKLILHQSVVHWSSLI